MATIKSYSDLQQSKKLAEILPLESADMYYPNRTDVKYQGALPIEFKLGNPLLSQEIACWSLATLLGRLSFPVLYMEMVAGIMLWCCECHFIETDEMFKTEHYDNPVDACVAMIKKLHELKML